MTITQNYQACNTAHVKIDNSLNIGSGNIVPHWWYKAIIGAGGKPDLVSITLLSELLFLHRKTSGNEFNDGYIYFERKFNLTRAQLQEATLRLHQSGLVTRSFRVVIVNERKFPNELHLKLNIDRLVAIMPVSVNSNNSSDNDQGNIFSNDMLGNYPKGSSGNSGEHISNNKIFFKKNRSTNCDSNESKSGSNFVNLNNSFQQIKRLSLASFYPLIQSDINKLQILCGREFTANAINQILLSLSRKLPDHSFPNKKAFLCYMTKALKGEMRDAVAISGTDFHIKDTNSDFAREEKYLREVESSRDTSNIARLRRKLANVLDAKSAYNFLSSISFAAIDKKVASKFILNLRKPLNITEHQHQLVLKEIQAVYGSNIQTLDIKVSAWQGAIASSFKILDKTSDNNNLSSDLKNTDSIWDQVRQALILHFGKEGKALDQAWFSKLEAEVSENNKTIDLKAPSGFISSWIERNYLHLIEKLLGGMNFKLSGICQGQS